MTYFHCVMRKNFLMGVALSPLILLSCGEKKTSTTAAPSNPAAFAAIPVEAVVLKPVSISDAVEISGTILPYESTEIRPETSGRVVSLNINEGSYVNRGALLVKLFDGDLQAQLKKLEVQLQIAEKTEERQRELLKISGISQQDYDLSLLQVNNLKADIDLTRVNISKTEIRAPFNGRLGLRNISMGAYISPTNIIATISQVNQLKIEFSIPEKYSSQIARGQDVQFTLDGSPNNYTASVAATESTVEENTRSLRIRAIVKGSDKHLVPGTFAKVKIILGKNDNALMVPSKAIIPQARNKRVIVYRGGNPVFETVITGIRDSTSVQVLSGLKAGDTLVTTGLLFIRPESKLSLTKVQ